MLKDFFRFVKSDVAPAYGLMLGLIVFGCTVAVSNMS